MDERLRFVARLLEGESMTLACQEFGNRHWLGLFHGQPGARGWRRVLSERASRDGAGLDVLDLALDQVLATAA